MNRELEELERVDPHEIWQSEPYDFTPWLAEPDGLELLGKTLGMDLELVATEHSVGPYSADVVCVDAATGANVVIENQLTKTDHTHLGQILTYTAGLDAATVVWIATRFTDEHRAAMDWLNEHSGALTQFFGLELEVWRIGESARAPKFNVVAKPNDWTKAGGSPKEISG